MTLTTFAMAFALVASGAAVAQQADHSAHHAPAASAAAAPTIEGEIRKVDKEQRKVTLKHGPIARLDMPGMTMVFNVADLRMLDAIQPGDKVMFEAGSINGAPTVTAIDVVR